MDYILETTRCKLREIRLSDLDRLYELYEPESITRYMEPLFEERKKEEDYTKDYIEQIYGVFGFGMWVVVLKETGQIIGRAGVDPHILGDEIEIELGYMIAKEYQNQGIATEVCTAILSYMEQETAYERINCLMESENTASVALAKRLGFSFMEQMDCDGKNMDRYTKTLHFSR